MLYAIFSTKRAASPLYRDAVFLSPWHGLPASENTAVFCFEHLSASGGLVFKKFEFI
jgi:hypothetical protein